MASQQFECSSWLFNIPPNAIQGCFTSTSNHQVINLYKLGYKNVTHTKIDLQTVCTLVPWRRNQCSVSNLGHRHLKMINLHLRNCECFLWFSRSIYLHFNFEKKLTGFENWSFLACRWQFSTENTIFKKVKSSSLLLFYFLKWISKYWLHSQ